jgi:hypothetical protein
MSYSFIADSYPDDLRRLADAIHDRENIEADANLLPGSQDDAYPDAPSFLRRVAELLEEHEAENRSKE